MEHISRVEVADETVNFEVNSFARLSDGSVLVRRGETVILVTANVASSPRDGVDFLPLTVDFQERTHASGRIPGGYFKREGRPTERDVLTSRLLDRPIRSLIPDGFAHETQIIATLFSADPAHYPDTLALTAASFALCASKVPFDGPLACVRVARVDGQFVIDPSFEQMQETDLDLIVASTEKAIVMVEGGANELSEAEMIEALMLAHKSAQPYIEEQKRVLATFNRDKLPTSGPNVSDELYQSFVGDYGDELKKALLTHKEKLARSSSFKEASTKVKAEALEKGLVSDVDAGLLSTMIDRFKKETVRQQICQEKTRLDGRKLDEVRPIDVEVGLLPRTHGSALFTRGETRALVVTTLGTADDEQHIEMAEGSVYKKFMLHYNFPPYSVGEVRFLRGPGRREIGHGALAERSVARVLPEHDSFPYTIRVVSDIIESNGSSSMATVCGASLSMMDAGVPIQTPVAGIAMGLIEQDNEFHVLSDILGDEDHVGDMDFKVAGTERGITGLQMDIKISGVSHEILERALNQAREGRLHILGKMNEAIESPRQELSTYAPRIEMIQINPEKIGMVIGPSGKMIRSIVERTGAKIDIEDSGQVRIASSDQAAMQEAIDIIQGICEDPELDKVYKGTVKRVVDFGAFVEILPNKEGLLHISQIANQRVEKVEDFLSEGDEVEVKVIEINERDNKIRLSRKVLLDDYDPELDRSESQDQRRSRGGRNSRGRGDRQGSRGGRR